MKISLQKHGRRIALLIGLNVVLTLLTAGLLGPAASKLESRFGLVAWSGRAPFYLLLLYLGPSILMIAPGLLGGAAIGAAVAAPLVLWSHAADCPLLVQLGYLVSGGLQGILLTWIWRGHSADQTT